MSSRGTPVYYCIPADGDDPKSPNVFVMARPAQELTVGDVKAAFPLPGAYVFRFKQKYKQTYVWVDVEDDASAVPLYDGRIIAKLSRVKRVASEPSPAPSPASEEPRPKTRARRVSRRPSSGADLIGLNSESFDQGAPKESGGAQDDQGTLFDIFDGPVGGATQGAGGSAPAPAAAAHQGHASRHGTGEDLFGAAAPSTAAAAATTTSSGGGGGSATPGGTMHPVHSLGDMHGLDAHLSTTHPASAPGTPPRSRTPSGQPWRPAGQAQTPMGDATGGRRDRPQQQQQQEQQDDPNHSFQGVTAAENTILDMWK